MDANMLQLAITIGTPIVAGLAAYFAAQRGVAVALAKLETDMEWIKQQQVEHRKDDNEKFSEHGVRLMNLEHGYPETRRRN